MEFLVLAASWIFAQNTRGEFIYDLDRQRKVIDTVINRRPLNIMYWVQRQDGNYDLLDGQQRTLSICNFLITKLPYLIVMAIRSISIQ